MNLEALQAFTSHNEFIDPSDPKSKERVSEVSHELNSLMQQTATIQRQIKNTKSSIDGISAEINEETKSCANDLELIKKQQKLKPQYDLRVKFENKLDALNLQLANANNIYNIAKAKLDLIYKHSIASSRKEDVMTNASDNGSEQ